MAPLTNIQKAFNEISEKSESFQGPLTKDVFMGFFDSAVSDYNLSGDKVTELKSFKYPRELDKGDEKPSETEALTKRLSTLECALAKIATLTGYGNHLREFHMSKWEPKKSDMNKY